MRRMIFAMLLLTVSLQAFCQRTGTYLRQADEAYNAKNYSKAAGLYKRAEAGGVRLFYINTRLGDCNLALGDVASAEQNYKAAMEHASEKAAGVAAFNLSKVYLETGQYADALKVLQGLKAEGELEYRRQVNMADALMRMKDYTKAKSTLDALITKDDGSKTFTTAIQNRGYMLWEQGKLEDAKKDISLALSRLDKNTLPYWNTLSNLAVVKSELGDATAVGDIESVISWQKKNLSKTDRDHIISLRKKAEVMSALDRGKESIAAFKEYFSAEKENALGAMAGMSQQSRLDYWKMIRPLISECFTLKNEAPEFLYEVALFRRGVSLYSGHRIETSDRSLSLTHKDVAQKLKVDEAAVEFIKYPERDGYMYAALCMDKDAKCSFVPLFSEAEINKYKVMWKPLKKAICSTDEIDKNAVFRDSTLAGRIWDPVLDAVKAKKIYFAPDGIFQMLGIENFEYGPMQGVSAVRLSSTAELTRTPYHGTGDNLLIGGLDYNDAAEAESTEKANHEAANFLVQRTRSRLEGSFTYLLGAKAEADSIAPLFPATAVSRYTEEEAKANLGKVRYAHISTHGYSMDIDVTDASLAYRDTVSLDRSLLGSGIALTGANKAYRTPSLEDGLLSAREVSELDLTNLDFIILSACQTAQGTVSDEGPAGMVRGLKIAGAHSVIATLWPVDDNATALFMTAFYRAWQSGNGVSKQEALEIARNTVKNHTVKVPEMEYKFDPKYARKRWMPIPGKFTDSYPYLSPFYWAAFIATDMID